MTDLVLSKAKNIIKASKMIYGIKNLLINSSRTNKEDKQGQGQDNNVP